MAAALAASGCLVTSVPDYETPKMTRPFLLDGTADPSLAEILEIKKDSTNPEKYPFTTFTVSVVSEDTGVRLKSFFYTDYGFYDEDANRPALFSTFAATLEPATIATGPRALSARYKPPNSAKPGCHTVTLMVAHDAGPENDQGQPEPPGFDDATQCPIRGDDAAQVTWRYVACEDANPCLDTFTVDDCKPIDEPKYCADVLAGAVQ